MTSMHSKPFLIRTALLLCVAFVLAACAAPIREEAAIEGKSLILAAIEVNADYGVGAFEAAPGTLYDLSLKIWGYRAAVGNVEQKYWPQSLSTRSRWIAFAVNPGTYALGEIVEQGNNGTLTIDRDRKTTRFNGDRELPVFEVAPNEALYIGTFRAQLGTNYGNVFGQIGGRLLRDVRKTYVLQTDLARIIASPYTKRGGRFRAIDVFSNSPGALAKFSLSWAVRPTDTNFEPEPVDEVEGGKGPKKVRDGLGE